LDGWINGVVGVEATPFAYGHFNGYPMNRDATDPSGGAIDWGRGAAQGYAMLPSEIWQHLRERGAKVVQVSHPRDAGTNSFMAYFTRAGLDFDFTNRTITGDPDYADVPQDWLRLPLGQSLFSDAFDALEVWTRLETEDTDGDGVLEFPMLDAQLR